MACGRHLSKLQKFDLSFRCLLSWHIGEGQAGNAKGQVDPHGSFDRKRLEGDRAVRSPHQDIGANSHTQSDRAGVGVGVGANVLVGGSNRTISLQPLSLEGSVGINLSLGVSGLTLTYVPR